MGFEMNQEQAIRELRQCITRFFQRSEELKDLPGEAAFGDASDRRLFERILALLQESGVDMEEWRQLEETQLGVLEMIQEGADPSQAVNVTYREMKGELL